MTKWVKYLLILQLVISIVLIVYFIYLAAAQPPSGWSDGFAAGFLEGVMSKKAPISFSYREAGRASASPVFMIILTGFGVTLFHRQNVNALRWLLVAICLYSIFNGSLPILTIIIFFLTFRSSTHSIDNKKLTTSEVK